MSEILSPSTTTPTKKEARSTQRLCRAFSQSAVAGPPLHVFSGCCIIHQTLGNHTGPFPHRAMVKPVLALLPVLGLTWLFGLLVHVSPTWAYAVVLLNSFQVFLGPDHIEWGLWNTETKRGCVVCQD